MARSRIRASKTGSSHDAEPAPARYWGATREPLYCLLFLLPLVVVYELGAALRTPSTWPQHQLVAPTLLRSLLAWFGAGGVWLPGAALAATLLIWHVAAGRPWRVRGRVLALMLAESLTLTLPLLALSRVLLQAGDASGATAADRVILALGAAVYEELVFRLYLITGLLWLATHVFSLPRRAALPSALAVAAVVFALCHFQPIGAEAFVWPRFLALALDGVYLSLVYLKRGLGVAAGCHAGFNLLLLAP